MSKKDMIFRLWCTLAVMLLTVSCVSDDVAPPPQAGDGKVRIVLNTTFSDYSAPVVTRADESAITPTPMVLVFTGLSGSAVFSEASQSVYDGSQTTVSLSTTDDPSTVVVIANGPSKFMKGNTEYDFTPAGLEAALLGTTLEDLQANLRTIPLEVPQTTLPYSTGTNLLPMAGSCSLSSGIDQNTKIFNRTEGTDQVMYLTRAVAKAHVSVDPSMTNFQVVGCGALNVARSGGLYSYYPFAYDNIPLTDYLTAGGDPISGAGTFANPLYIYETVLYDRPAILLHATLDGIHYYYRLQFVDHSGLIDVMRNNDYEFQIISAEPGYNSPLEAMEAPSSNLKYQIKVTDASTHDIVSNGQYYLGVSHSSIIVYDDTDGETLIEDAVRISTDMYSPDGFLTNEFSIPGYYLSITSPSNNRVVLPTTEGLSTVTTVDLKLSAGFTSGEIVIHLGNLEKRIRVERKRKSAFTGGVISLDEIDYVSCEMESSYNWVSVSTDNVNFFPGDLTLRESSPLYLKIAPNYAPEPREARLSVVRNELVGGSTGRTKIIIDQELLDADLVGEANRYMVRDRNILIPVWDQVSRAMAGYGGGVPAANPAADAVLPSDWLDLDGYAQWGVTVLWSDQNTVGNNVVVEGVVFMGDKTEDIEESEDPGDKTILVRPGSKEGNTIIALYKDKNGTGIYDEADGDVIVWSWHIWNTPYKPNVAGLPRPGHPIENGRTIVNGGSVYRHHNGRDVSSIFMDRNLGAAGVTINVDNTVAHSTLEERDATHGLVYQWGRKDPFPGGKVARLTGSYLNPEVDIYMGDGTVSAISSVVNDFSDNIFETSVMQPMEFYQSGNINPGNWMSANVNYHNSSLWGCTNITDPEGKTVFDPCPPGWKVPTSGNSTSVSDEAGFKYSPWAMRNVVSTNVEPYIGVTVNPETNGFNFDQDDYYTLGWYPLGGYRTPYVQSQPLVYVGNYGYFWSSSVSSANLGVTFRLYSNVVRPSDAIQKAAGASVQCVTEDSGHYNSEWVGGD